MLQLRSSGYAVLVSTNSGENVFGSGTTYADASKNAQETWAACGNYDEVDDHQDRIRIVPCSAGFVENCPGFEDTWGYFANIACTQEELDDEIDPDQS